MKLHTAYINQKGEIVTNSVNVNSVIPLEWVQNQFADYGTILISESREMLLEDLRELGLEIEDCK